MAGNEEAELKVRVSKSLIARIDEYRFSGRFPSRKAAVVELLETALGAAESRNGPSPQSGPRVR